MPVPRTCILCDSNDALFESLSYDSGTVQCGTCGRYVISDLARMEFLPGGDLYEKRHLVSGVVRAATDAGQLTHLVPNELEAVMRQASPLVDPLALADRVLLDTASRITRVDQDVRFPERDYPRYSLRDAGELAEIFRLLAAQALLRWTTEGRDFALRLTADGWRRVNALRATQPRSDQAFVAMRFLPEMKPAYEAIGRAIERAGYRPLRIDLEEHNDMIVDRIVAEIRRSAIIVADVTHHANGVYFEAGFGKGLGLTVVWSCRADHFDKRHFDIQQFNTIKWETEAELESRLYERIRATAPVRAIPGADLTKS